MLEEQFRLAAKSLPQGIVEIGKVIGVGPVSGTLRRNSHCPAKF